MTKIITKMTLVFALCMAIAAPAFAADFLETFKKKLKGSSWSYSVQNSKVSLHYSYAFVAPNKGGVFTYMINNTRESVDLTKYEVLPFDREDAEELDPNGKVKGVVNVYLRDDVYSSLLILNNKCMIELNAANAQLLKDGKEKTVCYKLQS